MSPTPAHHHHSATPSRRVIRARRLASAIVLSIAVATPAVAETTRLRFANDWRWEGPSAPLLLAKARGWFAEAGLDVRFTPGRGSRQAIPRVASDLFDLGSADLNALIKFRDINPDLNVVAVMILYNAPPFAVVGRRSLGVREPKDLEGRRLGAPPPDGAFAVWPAFARAAGVDRTKVNVVPVTFREREPALARGEVDAITGYSFSSWLGARAQGLPEDDLTLILMRHHGLDLYGNAIIASPWLVKERPEALASFLRVAVHAYREAFRVPDAAIEALAMHEPGIHIATETERLRLAIRDNFLTDEVRRFGFGAIDNDRLERAMDQLGETWDYLVRPRITDIFDPSFLPPLEERRVGPAPKAAPPARPPPGG